MPRSSILDHPQFAHFRRWRTLKRRVPLAESTMRSYATDVARFLRWLKQRELSTVDSSTISAFIRKLTRRGRSRMLSALSDFFAYAFEKQLITTDPLRSLKYRRSHHAIAGQMDFFELLSGAGLSEPRVQELTWADFVEPLVTHKRLRLRVGNRTVRLRPNVWNRLEVRFLSLAAAHGLEEVLDLLIA